MTDESTGNDIALQRSSVSARRTYFLIAAICAAILAATYWVSLSGATLPEPIFLPLHVLLELSSIIVSFAVFVTGWFGYRQTGNFRDLFLGLVFLVTGALDFTHTLTYKGMPTFFVQSGAPMATIFWILARFCVGVGLLWACFLRPKQRRGAFYPLFALAGAVLISSAAIGLVVHYYPASGALFYNVHEGKITPLKVVSEYLVIAMYAAAFVLCTRRMGWEESTVVPLRSALIVAIFAELAFTMYDDPFALMNFVGHIFKTSAYYLILVALFVSSLRRPYEELSEAKEELVDLYSDARDHRREIEQSFSRIGSALSSSIRLDEALGQIADLAMDMLHSDCSVVASLPTGQNTRQISAQRGDTHVAGRAIEVAIAVGKMAMEQQVSSIVHNDLRSTGWINCGYTADNCLRSIVCAPMHFEGAGLGVVAVYSHKFNAFEEGDKNLLEAFASHAAVAIHNAMIFERESRIADILQRSFMGPSTHQREHFEIAKVYASAMAESQVGGDFYDIIDLSGSKLAIVIGDVSGKGLAAAVHTAMAKYSLRAYLLEGHSPASALDLLNRTVAESTNIETFITLFCCVLDTQTSELLYASAGHEPAIYSANESYITLDSTGPALGLGIDLGYEEKPLNMEPGSVLLLYTDGVTEARHDKSFFGTEGVGKHLVACRNEPAEEIARRVHEAAIEFSGSNIKDDVAIVVVKAKG